MFGYHHTHYNMGMRQMAFWMKQTSPLNSLPERRIGSKAHLRSVCPCLSRSEEKVGGLRFKQLIVIVVSVFIGITGCTLDATPAPTPDLPRVQFVAPPNNSRVVNHTDLTIDLYAHDRTMGIAKIELYADGSLVKEASLPNYGVQTDFRVQVNWLASGLGFHVLSAIAYRPDGTRSDETFLSIEVVDG